MNVFRGKSAVVACRREDFYGGKRPLISETTGVIRERFHMCDCARGCDYRRIPGFRSIATLLDSLSNRTESHILEIMRTAAAGIHNFLRRDAAGTQ